MKIAVICNTDSLSIPSIVYLQKQGLLTSIGIPERSKNILYPQLCQSGIDSEKIIFIKEDHILEQLHSWLATTKPDTVWVFGFPWKIPEEILSIPPKGFFNFHFGLLPNYKGADPIFWQIKNKETNCGLTIHRMTKNIDGGPVVWKEEIPSIPGETYAMNCIRLGSFAVNILEQLVSKLNTDTLKEEIQKNTTSLYEKKPKTSDYTINWQIQTAEEIEYLVNACNPRYGGATTWIRGQEARILEVSPIDVNNPIETIAGTIVHVDTTYGIVVACSDKNFLRINILSMMEGYLSGIKLCAMGIKAGEKFY